LATASATLREGTLPSADGTPLFWQAWEVEAPKATFAVVHGLGEHCGRYERFATAMAGRGFSTFAVDLRGMGRSPGARGYIDRWSEWLQDAAALVAMVEEQGGAAEVIPLGHSLGGVVLLSAVIRQAVKARRFAVSNPALRLRVKVPGWKLSVGRMTSSLVPRLTLSSGVDPGVLSRDPAVVEAYRSDPLVHDKTSSRLFSEWMAACEEVYARAAEIRTPFLLILSQGDHLVDADGSHRLVQLAGDAPATVREYPDRYHEPFNDLGADQVFDDLAAWAAEAPVAPGPPPTS
jgi:alpha-beta hydrolase superfamily lysophospholipase